MYSINVLLSSVKAAMDEGLSPSNAWKKIEWKAKAWADAGYPSVPEAAPADDEVVTAKAQGQEVRIVDLPRDKANSAPSAEAQINVILEEGWELYQFLGCRAIFTRRSV